MILKRFSTDEDSNFLSINIDRKRDRIAIKIINLTERECNFHLTSVNGAAALLSLKKEAVGLSKSTQRFRPEGERERLA